MPNTDKSTTDSPVLHPKNPAQSVKELCNKLKDLRKSKNLSQQTLSETIGVSAGAISKYETGENSPSLETLIIYSQFFNVSIDYLLDQTKDQNRSLDARPYHTADPSQPSLEEVATHEDSNYEFNFTNSNLQEIFQQIVDINDAQIIDSRKILYQYHKLRKQLAPIKKVLDSHSLPVIITKLSTNNSTSFLSEVFGITEEQIQAMLDKEQKKST